MPIVDNISIHKNPKAFLDYILDKNKNNDMTYVTSLNLNAHDTESAVADLKRTFEMFDTKHSFTSRVSEEKSPVRVHHYIQSFNPKDNVTPELAHAIGVEWAKKCFGENAQVIVSTHVDKGHIHNHFAVGVYDLNGKHIISNYKTLREYRKRSDEIARAYGCSIIEKPKHKNTAKYNEWLARQSGTSWKESLQKTIDEIIMRDDILTIDDFKKELEKRHYKVRTGKYLTIKPPGKDKAVRTKRLGDGYELEDILYRIAHKDEEISRARLRELNGMQKEQGLYLQVIQVRLYKKKSKTVLYREIRENEKLLQFLSDHNISSLKQFENLVNETHEKKTELRAKVTAVKKKTEHLKEQLDAAVDEKEKQLYKKLLDDAWIESHELNVQLDEISKYSDECRDSYKLYLKNREESANEIRDEYAQQEQQLRGNTKKPTADNTVGEKADERQWKRSHH